MSNPMQAPDGQLQRSREQTGKEPGDPVSVSPCSDSLRNSGARGRGTVLYKQRKSQKTFFKSRKWTLLEGINIKHHFR